MLKYVLAGLISLFATSAFAGDRTITVSGEGAASAVPDVVYVHLGVVSEGTTVGKAMVKNRTAMSKVLAVLKEKGIPDKDYSTTNFNVSPKYSYQANQEPKLVGHQVTNDLKVTVRKLDSVGELLDALTADDRANVVSNITFDVCDKSKVTDEAREAAVADALRKAKLLAKCSGVKLGSVQTIVETSYNHPSPRAYAFAADKGEGRASTQISKGEQQFRVSVNLVISLEDLRKMPKINPVEDRGDNSKPDNIYPGRGDLHPDLRRILPWARD
jgi:uncharacterized protein YggE